MEDSEFALEVHSNHGQQKARKMYGKYENSYEMFVDLKSYVKGMLTHCKQEQAQEKQYNQGKVHFHYINMVSLWAVLIDPSVSQPVSVWRESMEAN